MSETFEKLQLSNFLMFLQGAFAQLLCELKSSIMGCVPIFQDCMD